MQYGRAGMPSINAKILGKLAMPKQPFWMSALESDVKVERVSEVMSDNIHSEGKEHSLEDNKNEESLVVQDQEEMAKDDAFTDDSEEKVDLIVQSEVEEEKMIENPIVEDENIFVINVSKEDPVAVELLDANVVEAIATENTESNLVIDKSDDIHENISSDFSNIHVDTPVAENSTPEATEETILEVEQQVDVMENIKLKILEESDIRGKRIQDYESLSNKLKKSMSVRLEAEKALLSEIESLRTSIEYEVTLEQSRSDKLTALYQVIEQEVILKQNALTAESKLLEDMKSIRSKIVETTILEQLDSAIDKKQSLLNIEKNICDDVRLCAAEINNEINEVLKSLNALKEALQSLPASDNSAAIRSYSWDDLEALQLMLAKNIKVR